MKRYELSARDGKLDTVDPPMLVMGGEGREPASWEGVECWIVTFMVLGGAALCGWAAHAWWVWR